MTTSPKAQKPDEGTINLIREILLPEIKKLGDKLDRLEDATNHNLHNLDKRLILVEKFIENRSKIELLLIGAIIAEAVGLLFLFVKLIFGI